MVKEAKAAGKTVRGYLSTVIGCPYEGPVAPSQVRKVADHLFSMGIDELSLGDTIGVGVPNQVEQLLEELFPHFAADKLAMHFHDTRGTALANIVKSLEMGITTFDSPLGDWADALMQKELQETSLLRTYCICSMKWG